MARVRFKAVTTPPRRQPVFEDQGAQEARRLQREGIRDVVWVAIGLGLILLVGMVYQWMQSSDRRAARQRADAAVRSAVPAGTYQIPPRYPSVEELQADQVVREARELAAANAAANASDPALNQQLAKPVAPAYVPTPPSMFGPQGPAPAPGALPTGAPPPVTLPQPAPTPTGPPR